jgi:hypothetical protein
LRWWCLSTPWSSFLSSFSSPFFISHLFFLVLHSRRERGGGEWVECVREWVEVSWFSCLRSLLCADMWVQKERKEDKTHLKWFCWIIGMADGLRDHRFGNFYLERRVWPCDLHLQSMSIEVVVELENTSWTISWRVIIKSIEGLIGVEPSWLRSIRGNR